MERDALQFTNTTALIPVEVEGELAKALEFWGSVKSLTITSEAENVAAAEAIGKLKGWIKTLDTRRVELKAPYHIRGAAIDARFRDVIPQLELGVRALDRGLGEYRMGVEREAREKQRLLDVAAEKARLAAEEKARAEAAKAASYEAQGRADMAAKAQARADVALEQAATILAPVVEVVRPAGTGFRTYYEAEVEDKATAVANMMQQSMLADLVSIDIKGIEKLALATKGKLAIPGIRITERRGTVSHGRGL